MDIIAAVAHHDFRIAMVTKPECEKIIKKNKKNSLGSVTKSARKKKGGHKQCLYFTDFAFSESDKYYGKNDESTFFSCSMWSAASPYVTLSKQLVANFQESMIHDYAKSTVECFDTESLKSV